MTQDKPTIEGNKLIAEFMGVEIGKDLYSWRLGCTEPIKEEHLNYHKEWGWLMPVVEKIRNDHFVAIEMYGDFSVCEIIKDRELPKHEQKIYSQAGDTITATYDAVIQFITFYNQQNPKQ